VTRFAYHAGERAVQARAGETAMADRVARGIGDAVPAVAAAFLQAQPFVVVAATAPDGHVWASLLAGPAGFASVPDERTVVLDALPRPGDPLAPALAAGAPAAVGLLAIEPASRRRMRVNGTARVRDGRLVVETDEVFANCPKYIQRRVPLDDGGAPPVGAGAPREGDHLDAAQRAEVAAADTFFVATAVPGRADASHRGGSPGFVRVAGDGRSLSWPDYTGNGMFMTLGNLAVAPAAGLLFADFETGDVLQVSGTAAVDWSPERAAAFPGAHRVIDLAVERVVARPGASPVRLAFVEPSRFNPPAA